jgi:hypothetical protein
MKAGNRWISLDSHLGQCWPRVGTPQMTNEWVTVVESTSMLLKYLLFPSLWHCPQWLCSWPCDLLWPMEYSEYDRDTSEVTQADSSVIAWLGSASPASPLTSKLQAAGGCCSNSLSSRARSCEKQTHSQSTTWWSCSQSTSLMWHEREMKVWCKLMGFQSYLLYDKSPDIRGKSYFI